MSLYSDEAFKSGKRDAVLWKNFDGPDWERGIFRLFVPGVLRGAVLLHNLIAVSYDAPDPQLAEHVLQSLAGVYLEKHMEVHRPGGQLHFFDKQTGESRRQLEEAEGKLMDFSKSHDANNSNAPTRGRSESRPFCLQLMFVRGNCGGECRAGLNSVKVSTIWKTRSSSLVGQVLSDPISSCSGWNGIRPPS